MRVSIECCIILLCLLTDGTVSSPNISTHFSARIRPSKLFDQSPFANGNSSLVYVNVTYKYLNDSDLMISEMDSNPLNESHILYRSYMNGRDKRGYFIVDGECIVHDIEGIPPVFLIVPSFMSFIFIYYFNQFNRIHTFSYKQCPYHEELECEGWTACDSNDKNDNVTFFLHGSAVLHYYTGYNPDKPVVFDQFIPGIQTIDKFEPPKESNCNPDKYA